MNSTKGVSRHKKDIVLGRVKDLREREKLTQAQFAESIDVSSNTISRIEREDMSLSSDIALKIADKYDISLDWLFLRGEKILSPKCQASIKEAIKCIEVQEYAPEQGLTNEEKSKKIKLSIHKVYSDIKK